jgi:chemotaxis protein MotB
VPISGTLTQKFPTNWELSTARATTILHFLQDKSGIPGERLSAVGYGEYRPIDSNSTAKGRAQNRRIQIVLTATGAR